MVQADITVTFHASQPGHWLFPKYCGRIDIVDIGLPQRAMSTVESPTLLMTPKVLAPAFKPRPRQSHKGQFGHVGCIGGQLGQTGAILLSADAAMAAGAGLATVGSSLDVIRALTGEAYEVMTQDFLELDQPSHSPSVKGLRFLVGARLLVIQCGGWLSGRDPGFSERPQVIDGCIESYYTNH